MYYAAWNMCNRLLQSYCLKGQDSEHYLPFSLQNNYKGGGLRRLRPEHPPLIWDVKKEVFVSTANNKPTESVSLNAFKQPRSFYLIFSIELWERFGFYGLQGIMAVYLVKQLGMSEADSITLFSSFSALVYGLVAIGGWLGDKVLGTKRVIMLGAIVLAIGYGLVAWSGHDAGIVYIGMATIAVGNGLFKANPSSLLSTCYEKNDPRLDGAFTMYYMSINIGSFFSMLATPWLAAKFGWSVAFALSFVGLVITIVNFTFCQRWVKQYGSKPDFAPLQIGKLLANYRWRGGSHRDCNLAAAQPGYCTYGAGRGCAGHHRYFR